MCLEVILSSARTLTPAVLFCALGGVRAGAQSRGPVTIVARVVDSAQVPVAGADVSAIHDLTQVAAAGATDARGERVLRVNGQFPAYEIVVRKLGYSRASRFVQVGNRDSISVRITLTRVSQRLDTIRVSAEQNRSRARTTIDADAIAASDRPLFDAIDVIEKLRPNMTLEPADITGNCKPAKNLFVNGVLVASQPTGPGVMGRTPRTTVDGSRAASIGVPHARIGAALAAASDDALLALGTIKPEHIEAIEYRNCTQASVGRLHDESALFVVLKEGVQFTLGRGSYVISAARQDSVLRASTRRPPALPSAEVLTPSWRLRILGIFDAESGAPLDSVTITEVATGTRTFTSSSGTVSLVFMQDGAGRLAFSKAGFKPDTISVRIAPADTLPITAVLIRAP